MIQKFYCTCNNLSLYLEVLQMLDEFEFERTRKIAYKYTENVSTPETDTAQQHHLNFDDALSLWC